MHYILWWHWLLVLAFLVTWILGAGRLMQRALEQHAETRRARSGRGMLVTFLAGLAGVTVGGALLRAGMVAFPPEDPDAFPIPIVAIIAGIVGFLGISWLVVFAMANTSGKQTTSIWAPATGLTIVLAAAIGGPIGWTALAARQETLLEKRLVTEASTQLGQILGVLLQQRDRLPDDLKELVERGLPEETLAGPEGWSGGDAFLYVRPARLGDAPENEKRLLIVTQTGMFPSGRRIVVYADTPRQQSDLDERAFAPVIGLEQNKAMAEKIKAE